MSEHYRTVEEGRGTNESIHTFFWNKAIPIEPRGFISELGDRLNWLAEECHLLLAVGRAGENVEALRQLAIRMERSEESEMYAIKSANVGVPAYIPRELGEEIKRVGLLLICSQVPQLTDLLGIPS